MNPDFRRSLRKNQTDAEQRLWYFLRNRQLKGLKFRRQHPIAGFVVDFVCVETKMIIELDGGQHVERASYDQARTDTLQALGYRVLRFWNDDVLKRTDVVLEEIVRQLDVGESAGSPSP